MAKEDSWPAKGRRHIEEQITTILDEAVGASTAGEPSRRPVVTPHERTPGSQPRHQLVRKERASDVPRTGTDRERVNTANSAHRLSKSMPASPRR